MNDMTPTSAERAEKLEGMGCRRKRVEDIRFVQGKGNYVDDIKLRGRWRSTESARRYIQAGHAILLSVQVPSGAVATAWMLAADVALSLYMTLSQYHL